jgi:hypothetical protein
MCTVCVLGSVPSGITAKDLPAEKPVGLLSIV